MNREECAELYPRAEALLFASGTPVDDRMLADLLEIEEDQVGEFMTSFSDWYAGRGMLPIRVGTGWQLCTREEYGPLVREKLGLRREVTLSPSLLEVLAIIAYRQPVTRAYIEQVRGVDCTYAIGALCDRGLIEVQGRLDVPGRPSLYGTTDSFLRVFGLDTLEALPPIALFGAETVGFSADVSTEKDTLLSEEADQKEASEVSIDAAEHAGKTEDADTEI